MSRGLFIFPMASSIKVMVKRILRKTRLSTRSARRSDQNRPRPSRTPLRRMGGVNPFQLCWVLRSNSPALSTDKCFSDEMITDALVLALFGPGESAHQRTRPVHVAAPGLRQEWDLPKPMRRECLHLGARLFADGFPILVALGKRVVATPPALLAVSRSQVAAPKCDLAFPKGRVCSCVHCPRFSGARSLMEKASRGARPVVKIGVRPSKPPESPGGSS